MDICVFETMNLSIPMIDIGGVLYTSNEVISAAFGIDNSSLRQVMRRHRERFSGKTLGDLLSVTDCHARDLKDTLKIKQLKKETVLWSHRDLIHAGMLLTGDTARAFQEDVIDLIERQARRHYVSREKFEECLKENAKLCSMIEFMRSSMQEYDARITALEETKKSMASCAGRALHLVRNA